MKNNIKVFWLFVNESAVVAGGYPREGVVSLS
jgi:hypothetical protein